jgi:hypothetical protein
LLPALEIPPDIWMQAWLRSLQVNLALRRDQIMIQCTLLSRETDYGVIRIGLVSGRFCGRNCVWLVPEWYLIDQAN